MGTGDAARLLGLPLILFDDKEKNLTDTIHKGHVRNVGVVVRRGDATHRRVHPRNQHMVINHPHSWVYWSWRFARLFPQPEPIEGPPTQCLEADLLERSQPLHINNSLPVENLFQYQRAPNSENLAGVQKSSRCNCQLVRPIKSRVRSYCAQALLLNNLPTSLS